MVDPFFIDESFIFRLESVICKKYTNTNGKDSNYTNAINISITWSCGGGIGGRGGGGVGSACSFVACIGSISATFFLHRLGYFLSTYSCISLCLCVLPQHVLDLL